MTIKNWKIGDIVKVGNIKNVRVLSVGKDNKNRNCFVLETIIGNKKYKYSFLKGIERMM